MKSTQNLMKCTLPTPKKFALGTQRNPYCTDWHWGFALGVTQIFAFLDTNMLVSPTQNSGVGGLSQRQDPTQMVLRRSGIKALGLFKSYQITLALTSLTNQHLATRL